MLEGSSEISRRNRYKRPQNRILQCVIMEKKKVANAKKAVYLMVIRFTLQEFVFVVDNIDDKSCSQTKFLSTNKVFSSIDIERT